MIGADFAEVLARAQAGDEAAFARLWRDVNPALVRYLHVMAGEAREDVAADTWLSVVKGLRRFRGDEPAWRAWVFTTSRRRAIDAGRTAARDRSRAASAPTPAGEAQAPDCAETALENLDTRAALAVVAQLPRLQAEVILLRVVAGLPAETVARVVGRSPGAVRVASHRGLKRLAVLMATRGVTPTEDPAFRT